MSDFDLGLWLGFSLGALLVLAGWAFFRQLVRSSLARRLPRPRRKGPKGPDREYVARVERKFGRL